ncbi:MAG: prepilin-type N-terminal cleavage/methylation domain-containing protein, partial [Deltaproteobacteria bacterium]|nr:prepilin-type N-terminal cleavage/methylation domain-containing protein [Deltaproteobacteria bacterium]
MIKKGESKGFTLLEVLIAIVVLSVALLALGGLQIISIRGNS